MNHENKLLLSKAVKAPAFLLFGTLISFASVHSAFAIRNGILTHDLPKSVFGMDTSTQDGKKAYCTATAVLYSRCIVTAPHCIVDGDTIRVHQADDIDLLTGKDITGKEQNIEKSEKYNADTPDDLRWKEIAVAFLENKKSNTEIQRLQEPADYQPLNIGTNLGLSSQQFVGAIPGTQSAGSTDVGLMGFGVAKTVRSPDGQLDEQGAGVKRKGTARAWSFFQGPMQTEPRDGSFYIIEPKHPDPENSASQIACQADSGGPLFKANDYTTTYGVTSEQFPANKLCKDITHNIYTAFDVSKRPGELSSEEWLIRAARSTCAKKVSVTMLPPIAPFVQISGILSANGPTYADSLTMNGKIDTANYDSFEKVHERETLTLKVDPTYLTCKNKKVFDRWVGFPCIEGNYTGTCTLKYKDLGTYTSEVSIDDTYGSAVFMSCGGSSA